MYFVHWLLLGQTNRGTNTHRYPNTCHVDNMADRWQSMGYQEESCCVRWARSTSFRQSTAKPRFSSWIWIAESSKLPRDIWHLRKVKLASFTQDGHRARCPTSASAMM